MIGMTGFGSAVRECRGFQVSARIHGVNHRALDLVFRLPDEARGCEPALRERLVAAARRGRCELVVAVHRSAPAPSATVAIRSELVSALHESARALIESGIVRAELSLGDLIRNPALVSIGQAAAELEPEEVATLLAAFAEALEAFAATRGEEGARTERSLRAILTDLDRLEAAIAGVIPGAHARLQTALRGRLEEISSGAHSVDPERWVHEAALLAEKADVREEAERFAAHLDALRAALDLPHAIGRRLDFLGQELLRELNTMAAKCRDVELVQLALEARLLCEQIREQAQNVE